MKLEAKTAKAISDIINAITVAEKMAIRYKTGASELSATWERGASVNRLLLADLFGICLPTLEVERIELQYSQEMQTMLKFKTNYYTELLEA